MRYEITWSSMFNVVIKQNNSNTIAREESSITVIVIQWLVRRPPPLRSPWLPHRYCVKREQRTSSSTRTSESLLRGHFKRLPSRIARTPTLPRWQSPDSICFLFSSSRSLSCYKCGMSIRKLERGSGRTGRKTRVPWCSPQWRMRQERRTNRQWPSKAILLCREHQSCLTKRLSKYIRDAEKAPSSANSFFFFLMSYLLGTFVRSNCSSTELHQSWFHFYFQFSFFDRAFLRGSRSPVFSNVRMFLGGNDCALAIAKLTK